MFGFVGGAVETKGEQLNQGGAEAHKGSLRVKIVFNCMSQKFAQSVLFYLSSISCK